MKERHCAYKIVKGSSGLICQQSEFEEDKMLDLLKEILEVHAKGIYWVFKQLNGKPQEALCLIDCEHDRIYYHYSGEVEDIKDTLRKLTPKA